MATLVSDGRIIIDSSTGRENWTSAEIKRLGINLVAIANTMREGSLIPLWYYRDSNNQLVLTKVSSNKYSLAMVHPAALKNAILYASFQIA